MPRSWGALRHFSGGSHFLANSPLAFATVATTGLFLVATVHTRTASDFDTGIDLGLTAGGALHGALLLDGDDANLEVAALRLRLTHNVGLVLGHGWYSFRFDGFCLLLKRHTRVREAARVILQSLVGSLSLVVVDGMLWLRTAVVRWWFAVCFRKALHH